MTKRAEGQSLVVQFWEGDCASHQSGVAKAEESRQAAESRTAGKI